MAFIGYARLNTFDGLKEKYNGKAENLIITQFERVSRILRIKGRIGPEKKAR
jgi:hypothetical protein